MLIAIFALLLISVVAIALLVSSGTDTTLAGNYRTSTSAYYAGLAGLEEGRGRLSSRNPDFINKKAPNFLPLQAPTNIPPTGPSQLLYILNPANGETVAPTDLSNSATYPDREYSREFHVAPDSSAPMISSTFSSSTIPGPMYKWVRITPATEFSLKEDVDQLNGITDSPLYYDPSKPSLVTNQTAQQAIEITALAALPNNTQKLMQYVVVPRSTLNYLPPGSLSPSELITFPATLTLVGNGVSYAGPNSTSFNINGNDATTGRTCSTPPVSPVLALGYTNSSDSGTVLPGTSAQPAQYTGAPPPAPASATPSVGQVSFPNNLLNVSYWEALLQSVRQNYDVYLAPTAPATSVAGSALPSSSIMTAANPMTVFVDGDLDLTGWHQMGFGLLVVTGNLRYDPDASWAGVVLVIGKGTVTAPAHSGSGRIDGAMLVAKTRDVNGNVLPNLGPASVIYDPNVQGLGIYYNSCWIYAALQPTSYKILSFREIPYP